MFCQLFGLAPNYTLAIIFRTCWGLMNSMLGVVKTYIAELCNVHTLAKGFSIMSAAGGLARYYLLFLYVNGIELLVLL